MANTLAALERLLEPQERLERVIAAAFRRFGPRLIDLSYANPCDGPPAAVLDALKRAAGQLTGLSLQYTPYAGRPATRRAVSSALCREYAMSFRADDVILTAGAMPALNVAARALFAPGDEVIVLTPAWQDYPLYLRSLGIRVRFVPVGPNKRLDLHAIAAAIGPATKGILFSQPCCPTGVLYRKDEIDGLSAVLRSAEQVFDTRIYVVSDEVHRHIVWSGRAFYSPVQSHPRTISIYSFGKALSLQGQRIGYIAVSPLMPENADVRARMARCVRLMGYGSPTSLMQRVVCDLLDYVPPLDALAERQARVRRALVSFGYDVCDGDATFYVYVKSPMPDDFTCAERLAAAGVLVVPSTLFHEPGYIRLSLTARTEAIDAALPAFERVMHAYLAGCDRLRAELPQIPVLA
ncbi:MAG TPA: aminotransferase class I/II-fold pyridoxal phosphate-dependent enzyme [Vicinamibacterales bacterium]|nr:aminotransferase class I/II-fold pyridoxal phosphate-dependent enzyme [Vicinamibacterales bacterium]